LGGRITVYGDGQDDDRIERSSADVGVVAL
jgi:hypothetical protein